MGLKNHNTMIRVCELVLWVWFVIKGCDLGERLNLWIDWWSNYFEEYKVGWITGIVGIDSN